MTTPIRATLILTGLSLFCWACFTSKGATQTTPSDLDELMELMTGSFNSAQQARKDTSYFDITLHMYPIWEDKGKWLYVEQSLSSRQDKPYRQRIYHLEQVAKGKFRSVVYTLPDPESYVGAWQEPQLFAALNPLELSLRGGCDVYLEKKGRQKYEGSTRGENCSSELAGASYASSEVSISAGLIQSWDRGFDDLGNQVWGAIEGAYRFKRQ
ncbi:MAG: chromophore lyase CpcT/CpeT [Bacteroidota bacterium]